MFTQDKKIIRQLLNEHRPIMKKEKFHVITLISGYPEHYQVEQDADIVEYFTCVIHSTSSFYITWNGKLVRRGEEFNKEHDEQLLIINFRGRGGSEWFEDYPDEDRMDEEGKQLYEKMKWKENRDRRLLRNTL
jgi:hypothetical protein